MTTFLAFVVLPKNVDISQPDEIFPAATLVMKAFTKIIDEDYPPDIDWFYCCPKEWLDQQGITYSEYTSAIPNHPYLLIPAERITPVSIPYAIFTPDKEWDWNTEEDDSIWARKVMEIGLRYSGHYVTLIKCHY